MNINNKYILIIWIGNCLIGFSQSDSILYNSGVAKIHLNEIILHDRLNLRSKIDYMNLKYKVLKVYHYLDTLRTILDSVDDDLTYFCDLSEPSTAKSATIGHILAIYVRI